MKLLVAIAVLSGLAVGQKIVAIAPGQSVVCAVPDKKYKFHFTKCDLVTHYVVTPGGEPIHVSAIVVGSKLGCESATSICMDHLIPIYSCADKERILEHSESGKYWCRKVQP